MFLANFGSLLRTEGDFDRARRLLQEAVALAGAEGAPWERASSLHELGCISRDLGDFESAHEHFVESLGLFSRLGVLSSAAVVLEALASIAAAEHPQRSVRLYGAAAELRRVSDTRALPVDVASHERTLSTIREALGDDAFETAFESGRRLTPEAALAEA
jgi:tetratricopeptide (TPR) repeat protein